MVFNPMNVVSLPRIDVHVRSLEHNTNKKEAYDDSHSVILRGKSP